MKDRGFTVVEVLAFFLLLSVVGLIFLSQKNALDAIHRDRDRKTAINEIYYNLQEVAYPALKGYPSTLSVKQLSTLDRSFLTDPAGHKIGSKDSDYRYEPTGCNGGTLCTGFTLRTELEREADFVKSSFR